MYVNSFFGSYLDSLDIRLLLFSYIYITTITFLKIIILLCFESVSARSILDIVNITPFY